MSKAAAAVQIDPLRKEQLDNYASAMKFFSQQKFDRAKPLFEKACQGNVREFAERARTHLAVCDGRIGGGKSHPKTADDMYHDAVVLMNAARYGEAEEWLAKAIKSGGARPHYAYAMACLRSLTNEADSALLHLQEAIAGDPHCRMLARNDRDLDVLMDDPRFTEILYPERA